MDQQHQKITGYRDLSQTEIDLMNAIKAHGAGLELLLADVYEHIRAQHKATYGEYVQQDENAPVGPIVRAESPEVQAAKLAEVDRLLSADAYRWREIAKTHFQQGLMALTRAVAQPTSF